MLCLSKCVCVCVYVCGVTGEVNKETGNGKVNIRAHAPQHPDIDEGRLEVAKKMGATYTVHVTTRDTRALAHQIEETLGCKPTESLECSGAQPSIATAIYVSYTRSL